MADRRDLFRLIKQGESQVLDFKFCVNDSRKIARSLVSFANTDGGTLLIGVKDNGNIAGIRSEEEYHMIEAAVQLYTRPQVYVDYQHWNIDGKKVLQVDIPPASIAHLAETEPQKWRAYIRKNDEDLLVNRVWWLSQKLKNSSSPINYQYTSIEKTLFEYLQKHTYISFGKFCKISRIGKFKAEKILARFLYWGILQMEYVNNNWQYRLENPV